MRRLFYFSRMTIDPKSTSTAELHGYLLGAVAPRPIAFASTIDKDGNVNLSPFSFFNVFSANPPILIFSPARRGRDNTTKHTFENVKAHAEVVVNIVNFDIVEQMSLSSTEYDQGVDEFIKSGLTKINSEKVKPPRVAESPVSMECKVMEVKELGQEGGAGNLVICEVLLIHIADDILDAAGKIDPYRIDQVSRLGGNWYSRARSGLFEVEKPLAKKGIGVDQIPVSIRTSDLLTGNHLGKLGNVESLPTSDEIDTYSSEPEVQAILSGLSDDPEQLMEELHKLAALHLEKSQVKEAWKVLLQSP